MLIIWGSRLYGKVDEVPGLFHVATKFGHLWYFPLIPMGSQIIIEKTAKGWRGVPVGLHAKSVFVTWLRILPFVPACIFGCFGVVATDFRGGMGAAVVLFMLAALCAAAGVFAWVHKSMRMARYDRAVDLGKKIGLSPIGNVMLEMHFGHMTQEEGRQLIARFKQQATGTTGAPGTYARAAPVDLEPIELEPER